MPKIETPISRIYAREVEEMVRRRDAGACFSPILSLQTLRKDNERFAHDDSTGALVISQVLAISVAKQMHPAWIANSCLNSREQFLGCTTSGKCNNL